MFGFGGGFNDYNRGRETTPNQPMPGKRSLSDMLMILGAGLKDSSSPEANNLGMVTQMQDQRRKEMQQAQRAAQMQAKLAELQANPNATRADWLAAFAGDLIGQNNIGAAMALAPEGPKEPTRYTTPQGIVEIGPEGSARNLYPFPEKPNTTPGQVNPESGRWEWAPGYVESLAQRTAATTTAGRQAQIANPLPLRPRAPARGRAGGAPKAPKLPAGFILD